MDKITVLDNTRAVLVDLLKHCLELRVTVPLASLLRKRGHNSTKLSKINYAVPVDIGLLKAALQQLKLIAVLWQICLHDFVGHLACLSLRCKLLQSLGIESFARCPAAVDVGYECCRSSLALKGVDPYPGIATLANCVLEASSCSL